MNEMLSESRFWSMIGVMDGEINEESLNRLGGALKQMKPLEIVAFDRRLLEIASRLEPVALYYPDGSLGVGDGRRALELALVSAGSEVLVAAIAAGPDGILVDRTPEFALELESLPRDMYEEVTDEAWPEPELWEKFSRQRTVLAYVGNDFPDNAFMRAANAALERWTASDTYAAAVRAQYGAFLCIGDVFDPFFHKPGSRWSSRSGSGGLEASFVIDLRDYPDLGAAAGERYVRDLIDGLARRRGLPTADETLGSWSAVDDPPTP